MILKFIIQQILQYLYQLLQNILLRLELETENYYLLILKILQEFKQALVQHQPTTQLLQQILLYGSVLLSQLQQTKIPTWQIINYQQVQMKRYNITCQLKEIIKKIPNNNKYINNFNHFDNKYKTKKLLKFLNFLKN